MIEYKKVFINGYDYISSEELEKLGKDRWEMCGVVIQQRTLEMNAGQMYFFKRSLLEYEM